MSLIPAHGGKLINRVLNLQEGTAASTAASALTSVTLSPREQCDLEMIGNRRLSRP